MFMLDSPARTPLSAAPKFNIIMILLLNTAGLIPPPVHNHKPGHNLEWTAKDARYAMLAHHHLLKCLCQGSIVVWMCCTTCLAEG